MPWNAIIGSFNSIDKIIVIKNIDWVAKKATSSTYFARAVLTIMIWFNQKGFKSHPNLSQHRQTKFYFILFQNCWMKKLSYDF